MRRVLGFTFIEVMLALAIVGTSLLAALALVAALVKNTTDYRDKTYALWLVNNLQVQASLSPIAVSGVVTYGGRSLHWWREGTDQDSEFWVSLSPDKRQSIYHYRAPEFTVLQ